MNILHSHMQGFILSIALNLTENWKVKKKWKLHFANVTRLISSSSPMFVSVLSKGLKPLKIFLTCLKAGIKSRLLGHLKKTKA